MKKPNTVTKKIAYCYPGSVYADIAFGRSGYFVESTIWNIEDSGECRSYPDQSAVAGMVYDTADDPELLQVFEEAEGIPYKVGQKG